MCSTVNGNLTVSNMLITGGISKIPSNVCREVDEMREERLRRRRECDRFRRQRETNEERHTKFVNLALALAYLVFTF